MGKRSRRPTRAARRGRAEVVTPATSDTGMLNREERRLAQQAGIVGPVHSPIPCQCSAGHRWFAPGTFQTGGGTYFDNGDDRWCPTCGEPEGHSARLGALPVGRHHNFTGWTA